MPNLDNVFNKFFPKSKTAPMGKKLILEEERLLGMEWGNLKELEQKVRLTQ